LFFLPPYAPDRNPGASVGKHLEAAGRMAITGQDDFKAKVRSSMRQPQNGPGKSSRSTGTPPSNAPHECAATHGLINPVQQIARGDKFLYLLSEQYQVATAHRFASFS
jgi:hypothetical protein